MYYGKNLAKNFMNFIKQRIVEIFSQSVYKLGGEYL